MRQIVVEDFEQWMFLRLLLRLVLVLALIYCHFDCGFALLQQVFLQFLGHEALDCLKVLLTYQCAQTLAQTKVYAALA